MKKTLLIMAAGLASRYGGNKQTAGLGPNGEMLMEYSIRDAAENGFDKVVFVIGETMLDSFKCMIDQRVEGIETAFAVQSYSGLPKWFSVPAGRTKPYGTVHAVLSARNYINEPFAVINADDYYGKKAFADLAAAIDASDSKGEGCMLAYPMINTLSGFGAVTRGICRIKDGVLTGIDETYSIKKCEDGTVRSFDKNEKGDQLDPALLVSMNIFGFMPWLFDELQICFESFLKGLNNNELKKEYPLPVFLDKLIGEKKIKINVVPTDANWFGVTYREDKEMVERLLRELG